MKVRKITLDPYRIGEFSNIRVKRISKDPRYELLTLGGFIDDELAAYAIFSHIIGSDQGNIFLEFVYVKPHLRGHRLAQELLARSKEYLDRLGKYDIIHKQYVKPENAVEYNNYMTDRGFIPLNVTQKILFYHLEDLLRPGALQLVHKNIKKLPKVVGVHEAGEAFVKNYLHSKGRSGISMQEINGKYSRFYIENNKIDGAILAAPNGDNSLFISAVIMDQIAKRRNVFLIFFSECLDAARKDMGDKISIIFQIDDDVTYRGLLKAFNPPGIELIDMEHMLLP